MSARIAFAVLTATFIGSFTAASAQPMSPVPPVAPPAPVVQDSSPMRTNTDSRLRARVEERYRVVTTRDGFVFVPRRARAGVQGIELVGDQLLVEGRAVSGGELRQRLGSDAEVLLALSYLSVEERLVLFGQRAADAETAVQVPTEPERRITRGRRQGARVRLGSDLYIAENERIEDAAVAVLGSIAIDGEVAGDVTAVGGSVRLGPKAVVRGAVTAVGGRIEASPTAQVLGETNEVALAWPRDWHSVQVGPDTRWRVIPDRGWWAGFAFTATSVRLTVFGLLGLVAVLLGGSVYRRAGDEVSASPWQATLIGLAAQLLFVPALIIVCGALLVSVIGIPVLALVPLALLALGLLWIVGFAAVAERVGRRVLRVSAGGPTSVLSYLTGFVLIVAMLWVSRLVLWTGATGFGWAFTIGLVGMAIEGLAWAAGLGALVLAWVRRPRVVATVPPIPTTPVVEGPASL